MKLFKYLMIPIIGILIIAAIPNNTKIVNQSNTENETLEVIDSFQLIKNNCLICHGAGSSHDNMIAPPMHAVKNHYWSNEITEEEFVSDIMNWVHDPKADNVQMPGAVNKFNIMPKIDVAEEDLKAIATYIYHNDIEKPNWCGSNEGGNMKNGNSELQKAQCSHKQKGNGCCSGDKSQGCNSKTNKKGCNHGPNNKTCKTK